MDLYMIALMDEVTFEHGDLEHCKLLSAQWS
jgi:hypothetical protein